MKNGWAVQIVIMPWEMADGASRATFGKEEVRCYDGHYESEAAAIEAAQRAGDAIRPDAIIAPLTVPEDVAKALAECIEVGAEGMGDDTDEMRDKVLKVAEELRVKPRSLLNEGDKRALANMIAVGLNSRYVIIDPSIAAGQSNKLSEHDLINALHEKVRKFFEHENGVLTPAEQNYINRGPEYP